MLEKKNGSYIHKNTLKRSEHKALYQDILCVSYLYRDAVKLVKTWLNILYDMYEKEDNHNPIHHIEYRIKTPESIIGKALRRGVSLDIDSIREKIYDIAGIRVICPYVDDVYHIADVLLKETDMKVLRTKDYIANPKKSGYRSLHLILQVPVNVSARTEYIPVEIQLRTIAMNMWASLEHEMQYKSEISAPTDETEKLRRCSDALAEIELVMQNMYREKFSEQYQNK